ncbi:DUF393 domain-containing protein [Candidatus Kaiserbacteria bacterium]|nr:DUF393 domain-containing protein [Candidatus Kaiserbacteria bacterium]
MEKIQEKVIFDGTCNLCNRAVTFIVARDTENKFLLIDKDDVLAQELKTHAGLPLNTTEETILLFKDGRYYTKSRAVLEILKSLGWPWSLLYVGVIIPAPIRDVLYDAINKSRFFLFGRKHIC